MCKQIVVFMLVTTVGCAGRSQVLSERAVVANVASLTDDRIANLERAAQYPWKDDGDCVVREASGDWQMLVDRCYHALDLARIQFRDLDHRCGTASADAATISQIVGVCLLVQPELVVGAIVVIGVVVIAAAIAAELQKLPCKCMCMDIDDLGRRHGPYLPGRTKNAYECRQLCLANQYKGPGFCGE